MAKRRAPVSSESLILYDGVCGLCNRLVQFVLPRDKAQHFRFAALQSDMARQTLAQLGRSADALDTFYLVEGYGGDAARLLTKSRAALAVARTLGWWWTAPLCVVPRFIADRVYDVVARRRYRWFGKHDSCPVPSPQYRDRFLDQA